jgi:hypothetical protein
MALLAEKLNVAPENVTDQATGQRIKLYSAWYIIIFLDFLIVDKERF